MNLYGAIFTPGRIFIIENQLNVKYFQKHLFCLEKLASYNNPTAHLVRFFLTFAEIIGLTSGVDKTAFQNMHGYYVIDQIMQII